MAFGGNIALDINTDPGYNKNMHLDMAPSGSMCLNDGKASNGSTDHSDQYVLQQQHGPQISRWSQVAALTIDLHGL